MKNNTTFNDIKTSVLKECRKSKNLKTMNTAYKHFDKPLSNKIKRSIIKRILRDDNYVSSYRSLPFIEYPITFQKYDRKKKHYEKKRIISLPSHHDAFLYKIYSKILYKCYENYLELNDLSEIPTAYRKGHSNITGAKDAIDNISLQNSWIIKGDFSHFFDNLNHDVLVKNVKKVLRRNDGEFTDDWRMILKNLMNYRYIERESIIKAMSHSSKSKVSYVDSLTEMDTLLKSGRLKVSEKHKVGIPQGTALSAILANVYMIEFDEWVKSYLQQLGGFYRRYSDDFIVVIPNKRISINKIREIEEKIISRSRNKLSLIIKKEKTHIYYFNQEKRQILLLDPKSASLRKSELNYLGFSFNGTAVNLRPKTIYKFHYKGKRAINSLVENIAIYQQAQEKTFDIENKKLTNWQIYVKENADKGYSIPKRKKYTQMYLVDRPIKKRNFLSYAWDAQRIFAEHSGFYEVNILKPALKQVGYLQRKFGEDKSKKTKLIKKDKNSWY